MNLKHILKRRVSILSVITIFILYGCNNDKGELITKADNSLKTEYSELTTVDEMIYVYVVGAVKNPGVYRISQESRIYQIIEMAGGLLEDADAGSINMADKLYDGMKITVYRIGEADYEGDVSSEDNGKININTADKERLMTLPGIGEAKAESIIRYREENGGFKETKDIMNISGIKEAAFEKIKDLIMV